MLTLCVNVENCITVVAVTAVVGLTVNVKLLLVDCGTASLIVIKYDVDALEVVAVPAICPDTLLKVNPLGRPGEIA